MQELKKIIQHHESIIPMEQMNIYVCAHGKIEREMMEKNIIFLSQQKLFHIKNNSIMY